MRAARTAGAVVQQQQQLGTGHAVAQVLPDIAAEQTVLVLYGDVPLTRADTLQRLLAAGRRRRPGFADRAPR